MRYIDKFISFLALVALFVGCGNENNNEKKIENKVYSSSKSCFVKTRSIFKNINAPVFTSPTTIKVYEARKDVATLVATERNGGNITYSICGRGLEYFTIDESSGAVRFRIKTDSTTRTEYKFIAIAEDSNDDKISTKIFTVNILKQVPPIIEDAGNKTLIIDSEITPIEIKNTGGAITTSSISPLSSGLVFTFDEDTVKISGTPAVGTETIDYKEHNITVSNTDGEDNATIRIKIVNPEAPSLKQVTSVVYAGVGVGELYKKGTLAESWYFTNSGGAIKTCTLTPAVPGLTIDNTSCTITGTPTTTKGQTPSVIRAVNAGGESIINTSIQVRD